jgi:hypothetical protein
MSIRLPLRSFLTLSAAALGVSAAFAQASLTPLPTFGGGDGWRAPTEVLTGDLAGTATGGLYNYLGTASLERGMAYNPVTGNLVLVSRSTAGNGIRVLNGSSGVDLGALNQGSGVITGGTFTTSTVGVGTDGQVYVANLQTNVSTGAFKIYNWADGNVGTVVNSTPFFNNTIAGYTGTPRHGDSLAVIGSGAGTTIVAGASGAVGYSVINSTGATAITSPFSPANPNAGDLRLGITFAGNNTTVWGKQTSALLRQTTYSGSAGNLTASVATTSAGDAAMAYTTITGVPYLAVLDMNNSNLRLYDVTNPAAPIQVALGNATTGTLTGNGNATGAVAWGAVDDLASTAVLYAMSSNQGIQAFIVAVPEPATVAMISTACVALGVGTWQYRRRRAALLNERVR